ncbi:MAG: alpha-glucan family phosphorylase [Actinomycetota bacterium]
MQPTFRFTVASELPERLAPLHDLAVNLRWAWDEEIAQVFDRVDDRPAGQRWRDRGEHPHTMLQTITPSRLTGLSDDDDLVDAINRAAARLAEVTGEHCWYADRGEQPLGIDETGAGGVAYFSPEFGITEMLPQYSGGLGILAGDHLKASSDLGVPLVGVGLWYSEGYFHQFLDGSGWQGERNDRVDPVAHGAHDTGHVVSVDLAGETAHLRVWRVDVGRVRLYLLDANIAENPASIRAVTDRLYGGDEQHRLRQEIVLGIGGVRALRAVGLRPDVFHMNEGHAGFAGLERVREWVDEGLTFAEALEAVRAGGVFTTHTPVPAGIDRFPRDLFERYFADYAPLLGITFDELFEFGTRADEPDGKFNMAVMGMRLAMRRNGVAALHGAVARQMFDGMWPTHGADETPIGHVTNGVHARTWVSTEVDDLLSGAVGDDWHLADAERFGAVRHLDHGAIWHVRNTGRRELVEMVRDRVHDDVLDPDVLTIGFARRFATYKRANLLLGDIDRLKRLLLHADRPVRFVFAGKAHPADQPGKSMIQQIHHVTRDADVRHRFVFLPDYDIGVARTMYHGCDVWLNTPRRPMEACGTSGMKAAMNGVLNCSILDGWWDEMSNGANGWDIPSYDQLDGVDEAERDRREAAAAFDLLERSVAPLFYDRPHEHTGVPHGWVERIVENWASLSWNVTAARMVRDYTTELYEPAARSAQAATADGAAPAKELAAWRSGVEAAWPGVSVELLAQDDAPFGDGVTGLERSATVLVHPGELAWRELVVELVHGPLRDDGSIDLARAEIVSLSNGAEPTALGDDGRAAFPVVFVPTVTGPCGVAARVLPTHPLLSTPLEPGLVAVP